MESKLCEGRRKSNGGTSGGEGVYKSGVESWRRVMRVMGRAAGVMDAGEVLRSCCCWVGRECWRVFAWLGSVVGRKV